ncbi:hypothetical protein [Scleromatobacter humisilvae]|uniref:Uncharacterized protein n=1 Tax=Scleromatobacter humisilvae TaxID=2897159 RepID=A0A9X1YEJ0_9BURK|nr:hypothetical protein [Scleromatobacter humisilvae]MCK9684809.1 hypothetical protein [Scleromatobacter humisilvae]
MIRSRFALGALALACAAAAQAAPHTRLSYVSEPSFLTAYLIDWDAATHRAHLVDFAGNADGTWTDDGTLRVLTLSAPIETTQDTFDCNGLPMTQTVDLRQVAVRHVSGGAHKGSAQVIEIGTTTDIGGCTPGLVTPYGSTSDPGTPTTYADMADRPGMDDLAHGATLAGMSDTDPAGVVDPTQLVARLTTFAHHSVTFADTGASVPRDLVDGWFVLDFGTFQRGYTRLSVDPHTHAETWLGAAWSSGGPTSVFQTMMVVPDASAGFGGHNAQAHVWNSGLFLQSDSPTDYQLYADNTGVFEEKDTSGNVLLSMPATWADSGANLVLTRSNNLASNFYVRTWVPIANYGKAHFVFENEDLHTVASGSVSVRILPRVNFYVDAGKATPPATTPAAHTLARKPAPEAVKGLPR